jgi:hypothetical protein
MRAFFFCKLKRFRAKHALVLDTWVGTGFPKSMPLGS